MQVHAGTLREVIERNAKWHGDRPAYVCEGKSVTHREFAEYADRIAAALYRAGLRPQDRVGLLSMNSLEFALAYGACEAHGFIAATVNFRLAPPEMEHVISDAGSSILILEQEFVPHIDQIRQNLAEVRRYVVIGEAPPWATDWDTFVAEGSEGPPPLSPPKLEDLAYLIYTSGTTGKSKGCMLDHAAEAATAQLIASAMGLGPEDRTLLVMPLFHIGAKAIANAQQWVGGTVTLHRRFDASAVLRTIEQEGVTATHMAPTLIQGLVEAPDRTHHDISTLRTVLYSAAAMPPSLLRAALEVFGPVFQQMYGQTEGIGTVLPVGAHRLGRDPRTEKRLTSIGHPFIGCEVSIRDEENRALPTGAIGEICLRGPAVMRGYWNNSRATLAALAGGWLHTGDVGTQDEDGYVYLVDRKKDVIISGGENIYSREVEEALLSHPSVSAAAVIGIPDRKWGEVVCAIVALRKGESVTEETLGEHCRAQIAGYKRPRRFVFVDNLPLLPSGKVNKPILRQTYAKPSEP
jgi:acyl-CoA synthetase (AMP-forming)/AMP-acid ligase II